MVRDSTDFSANIHELLILSLSAFNNLAEWGGNDTRARIFRHKGVAETLTSVALLEADLRKRSKSVVERVDWAAEVFANIAFDATPSLASSIFTHPRTFESLDKAMQGSQSYCVAAAKSIENLAEGTITARKEGDDKLWEDMREWACDDDGELNLSIVRCTLADGKGGVVDERDDSVRNMLHHLDLIEKLDVDGGGGGGRGGGYPGSATLTMPKNPPSPNEKTSPDFTSPTKATSPTTATSDSDDDELEFYCTSSGWVSSLR